MRDNNQSIQLFGYREARIREELRRDIFDELQKKEVEPAKDGGDPHPLRWVRDAVAAREPGGSSRRCFLNYSSQLSR